MKTSCCLHCHFVYEERNALPRLPRWASDLLEREHDDLRVRNFPWPKVEAHAQREMAFFRKYCPPAVVARIEADHQKFGAKYG